MKKRVLPVILSLALLLCAAVMPQSKAAAQKDQNIIFMAVNETFYPSALEESSLPVIISGLIYVPYSLFDSTSTGIDLGTYCILNQTKNILIIYMMRQMLTFDLSAGTVTDQEGNAYSFYAVTRNNNTYVPVMKVANFFGLGYELISTEYGSVIRLTNDQVVLSKDAFASAAIYTLQEQYNKWNSNSGQDDETGQPTGAGTSATPGASSQPGDTAEDTGSGDQQEPTVRISFAFRVEEGAELENVLSVLSLRSTSGIFFLKPEDLAGYDDEIRAILATGNQIGFMVSSEEYEDYEALLKTMEEGNDTLRSIAWVQSHFVLLEGGNPDTLAAITEAGWLDWEGNVTSTSSTAILNAVGAMSSAARITITLDSPDATTLVARVLNKLLEKEYTISPIQETDF